MSLVQLMGKTMGYVFLFLKLAIQLYLMYVQIMAEVLLLTI